jgi:hypothetical protein
MSPNKNLITGTLIIFFLGLIPVSCVDQCDGPCGCSPVFEVEDFSVTSLSTETLFRADKNFEVDPNRFYFYQTLYKAFWVSGLKPVSESIPENKGIGFYNAAYACSPLESYSLEKLRSIRLVNRRKLVVNENTTLEEGQVINERFVLTQNFQQEYGITDFLRNNHRFQKNERLYLKFKTAPDRNVELFFDLEIELDNGSVYIFNETMKVNGG